MARSGETAQRNGHTRISHGDVNFSTLAVFTTAQAGVVCGVATRTITVWCNQGKLRCDVLPGTGHRRIHREYLLEFVGKYFPGGVAEARLLGQRAEPRYCALTLDLPIGWAMALSAAGYLQIPCHGILELAAAIGARKAEFVVFGGPFNSATDASLALLADDYQVHLFRAMPDDAEFPQAPNRAHQSSSPAQLIEWLNAFTPKKSGDRNG